MTVQKTLGIIKPDAVSKGYTMDILDRIVLEGFTIVKKKQIVLSQDEAESFP